MMRFGKLISIGFFCLLLLTSGGCRKRSAQAAAPVVIFPPAETPAPVQPVAKPEEKPAVETKPEEAPKTPAEPVAPPSKRTSTHPAPPRPQPQPPENPPPSTSDPGSAKPAPPRITPGLSPAELAEYQKQALDSISLAEKNLKYAGGKNLNAGQRDLKEKVEGFLAQAQDARNEGDWVRARNLADKARVLSIELVNSL